MRTLLLKSIPYLMAIIGGMVLFLAAKDNVHNPDWVDLINNIAASLLAIPLVFLLYDYSNYRIAKQLNRVTAINMHDKIDSILINIIVLLRQMMGLRDKLTLTGLNKMADMQTAQIISKLKMTAPQIKDLMSLHHELDDCIYRNSTGGVLTLPQIQALTDLSHNILRLINTHRFHQGRRPGAHYIREIIRFVMDWVDADASISARFQQLLDGAGADTAAPTVNNKTTNNQ